jgi:hypothetical protein
MPEEPDSIVLVMLRDIRDTLDDHSQRLGRVEKKLDDLAKLVTYSLGQSTETQFRQQQQESRIDELFDKLDRLFSGRDSNE